MKRFRRNKTAIHCFNAGCADTLQINNNDVNCLFIMHEKTEMVLREARI